MKKAPHYEAPLSKSRFLSRHTESSSTPQNNKQEVAENGIDDCPERSHLSCQFYNPSAPNTDAELRSFIMEEAQTLEGELSQLVIDGGVSC